MVCGFVGTYADLHAALTQVTRNSGSTYPFAIRNPNILSTRFAHTPGWASESVGRRVNRGQRLYVWWWCDDEPVPDKVARQKIVTQLGYQKRAA